MCKAACCISLNAQGSLYFSHLEVGSNTECKECAFGRLRAPGENLSLLLFSCVI